MVRRSDTIPILYTRDIFDTVAMNVNATETQTCGQAAAIRPGPPWDHPPPEDGPKEEKEEKTEKNIYKDFLW